MIRKLVLVFLYLVGFLGVSAAAGYITFLVLVSESRVEAPNLIGKSIADARRLLTGKGITLKTGEERFDNEIPAGHIIAQEVEPGRKIRKGSSLGVVVSRGARMSMVATVVGDMYDKVKADLKKRGVNVLNVIDVYSDKIEKGRIIAQNNATSEENEGESALIVSRGPKPIKYYCPTYLGMLVEDALALNEKLGLIVQLYNPEYVGNEEVYKALDVVRDQKPAPGETMSPGDKVYLTIGKGTE